MLTLEPSGVPVELPCGQQLRDERLRVHIRRLAFPVEHVESHSTTPAGERMQDGHTPDQIRTGLVWTSRRSVRGVPRSEGCK